jgi:hypothetical protein
MRGVIAAICAPIFTPTFTRMRAISNVVALKYAVAM